MDERFDGMDELFSNMHASMDERFAQAHASMDKRFSDHGFQLEILLELVRGNTKREKKLRDGFADHEARISRLASVA